MQPRPAPSAPGRRLGAEWGFVSDHLPLGLTLGWVDGTAVRAVSWNVLNSAHLRWIYMDEQGLLGSLITQHDVLDGDGPLSRRDLAVVDAVVDLALGATPRAVVCLQGCSAQVRQVRRLPRHQVIMDSLARKGAGFGLLAGTDQGEVVTLYSKRLLGAAPLPEIRYSRYPEGRSKTMLPTLFTETLSGKRFLVLNTDCPFARGSRLEMASHALRVAAEHGVPAVAVGDFNATSTKVRASFARAAAGLGVHNPFSWVPVRAKALNQGYRTHVDVSLRFCDHDNAHFAHGGTGATVVCDEPAAVLRGLPGLVGLLYSL